jgi:hypothetical protein
MKPLALLLVLARIATADTAVRVLFGIGDEPATRWDGSAVARGAQIISVEPWRFDGDDAILPNNSWKASLHPIRLFGGQAKQLPKKKQNNAIANGVVLTLSAAAEVAIKTTQGDFSFNLRDLAYASPVRFLNNRVAVELMPPARRITNSPEEQDYPAAAVDKNGEIWVAYVEFKHHPDHNRMRANMQQPLKDFAPLKSAAGGDQLYLRKLSNGNPIEVTSGGLDLYRPAIAVDGSNRVWVFWPQNDAGNFDLWARVIENGKAAAPVRITREPGSDIDPVAATDSNGRVHVAWQGWRNGKATIFGASQNASGFTAPVAIGASTGNEWNPAIAASRDGRITVAWDSYRNGNYDIFARTASNGVWGREIAIASTATYETYPSIAYDPRGRLWVAYEEGTQRWGKDWGAYETSGYAIYQGRAIRVVGLDGDGTLVAPRTDPGTALLGTPSQRADLAPRQVDSNTRWIEPQPSGASQRGNSAAPGPMAAQPPRNTSPRLIADGSGRLWLAFRSAHPIWWNPIGTSWSEYVVSYTGEVWQGPIPLFHTDNILDNRPALVSPGDGKLVAINSSDGRRDFFKTGGAPALTNGSPDPHNNDLWASSIELGPATATQVTAARPSTAAALTAEDKTERDAVARLRAYRAGNLRIARGEFHRHSEISMDGGNDGTLLDQWRYILDAAGLDWVGCCDHDNGGGREYSWWIQQKLTDIFYTPNRFVSMFSYERSVAYPEGHRNVLFTQRGIRTLPRLVPISSPDIRAPAPDTEMLYGYLKHFNGVVASHTSGTNMGTDWRNNDPLAEPVVEIYQGMRQNYEMPDAPRSNSADDSIGGWRPLGFINLALEKGYKLGFEASSDHVSTHISYANLMVKSLTRDDLLDAFKKRHIYAATDNILADVRSGTNMAGDSFTTASQPVLQVRLEGTAPFAKVHIVKDGKYAYSVEPKTARVSFSWRDSAAERGKTSYYYVRGEQQDGEIVWVSPMWITYK